jgi:hypothetical protein
MIYPEISLDFTSAALDPRITFARSGGTATVVNSSGVIVGVAADIPRFDFDPITLACRGLLVEAAATNSQIRSSEFEIVSWLKAGATVSANAETAPDGTLSADKIVEDTSTGIHRILTNTGIVTVSATAYTLSVYAKGAGRNLRLTNNNLSGADFDLTSGTVSGTGTIEPAYFLGSGWYRCSITRTPGTTDRIVAYLMSGTSVSYTGDGSSGIFLWGAQHELGVVATSYIPTVGAAVTRNADIATITGTNFSDWWQAGKGSALVRARPLTVSGTRPLIQFDDTTADNIIALRGNTTNPELYVRVGGSDQAQIDAGTIAANTRYLLAGSWGENNCAASVNSRTPVLGGVATIPVVTQARLGSDGTNYLNGHLEAVEYYDERVLNASLQVLSSQAGRRSIIGPVFRDSIIS